MAGLKWTEHKKGFIISLPWCYYFFGDEEDDPLFEKRGEHHFKISSSFYIPYVFGEVSGG